jgi:hypothetical protein
MIGRGGGFIRIELRGRAAQVPPHFPSDFLEGWHSQQ